jgi:hypothetical protein
MGCLGVGFVGVCVARRREACAHVGGAFLKTRFFTDIVCADCIDQKYRLYGRAI